MSKGKVDYESTGEEYKKVYMDRNCHFRGVYILSTRVLIQQRLGMARKTREKYGKHRNSVEDGAQ